MKLQRKNSFLTVIVRQGEVAPAQMVEAMEKWKLEHPEAFDVEWTPLVVPGWVGGGIKEKIDNTFFVLFSYKL